MAKKCEACKWYKDNCCHLNPPIRVAETHHRGSGMPAVQVYSWVFPHVNAGDFCSHWLQRKR